MSDLKLFEINDGRATELTGKAFALELSLQKLIDSNMETLFSTRFVASEYSTGVKHGGRIDSLGLDENGSPVIFEYKRASNENVINQGLFYLDWLLDHRAEFELLVIRTLDQEAAKEIDWKNPRLVCVAGDFTKYDEHAVQQINRSIELVRYRDFSGKLLALELVTARTATSSATDSTPSSDTKTVSDYLNQSPATLRDLYAEFETFAKTLGDDVTKKTLKLYFAFRRLKNFACVEVHPTTHTLLTYLKVDPSTVQIEKGFTRDVRKIGHFGTGDLEVRIRNRADLEKASPLIQQAYDVS